MRKSLLIVVLSFVIAVVLINLFVDAPEFDNPKDKLEFALKERQKGRIDLIYLELITEDSLNIDYHYGFLINNPEIRFSNVSNRVNQIIQIYNSYSLNQKASISDLGYYGLGLISSIQNDYVQALLYFEQVSNKELKYLNNSKGRAYESIQDFTEAENCYKRAIEVRGNVEGAYSNLISLYYSQSRYDDLHVLLKDKEARQYFPAQLKRYLYLSKLNLFGYFRSVIGFTSQNQNLIGFLGALLVMLSWLFYLRRLDIYEPEKWKTMGFTFILGVIFSELTFLLSDLNTMFTGFTLNGNIFNDLMYCIIGIGVIEELVKIIPVLIILKYTHAINEPVDYLIYGSVSALGFAFAENLLYFNSYGPQIIMGRALTAVVFHMFLTSLATYGIMLSKYKASKGILSDSIKFFLLASLIHGLYDFWLINQSVSRFGIISMIILVLCFSLYNTLISNALSNSEFFDENIHLNRKKLQNYLLYSLSGILMFQYLAVSFKFGHQTGGESLKNSLISGGYLIVFITANLGTINIKRKTWKPLQIKFPRFSFKLDYNPDDILGEEFTITQLSANHYLKKLLPNNGIIKKRTSVEDSEGWYLVELNHKKEIIDFCGDYILIKSRNPQKHIQKGKHIEVGIYVFLSEDKIDAESKHREDFMFLGWAKVK